MADQHATPDSASNHGADLFTRSVDDVLAYLTRATELQSWSVSRITNGEQIHLHAQGSGLLSVGQRVEWNETFCKQMLTGAARVVADSTLDPEYSHLSAVPTVRAYASAPLIGPDGEVFGTLCGVSDTPLSDAAAVDADLVAVFSHLLSSQLASARHLDQALERESRASTSARTDALTGLLNRRGWDERIAQAQDRANAFGDSVGLAMLDLDGLKKINDIEGHAAGDDLLRRAAAVLGNSVRRDDAVARVGGDEFAILLEGVTLDQMYERVDDLVLALADVGIAASAGGTIASVGALDLTAALAEADEQMYRVKRERKAGGGTLPALTP